MSLVRVLRTAQHTLIRKIYADETLTDAAAPPTVQVARLDGTVLTSGTASDETGTGVYGFVLPGGPADPASVTWQLDTLKVTWTGSIGGAVVTLPPDYVEIVGGFYFGLAEARAAHTGLSNESTYPTELVAAKRIQVEQECDRITGRAFVPRFKRLVVPGTGRAHLLVPLADLRIIRTVTVDGSTVDGGAVTGYESGVVTRRGAVWPSGSQVVLELEHGSDYPPEEISAVGILRLRSILAATTTGVPDRAISYTVQDGGVYRLSTPSGERTGVPTVDGVYERYTLNVGAFA